MPDASNDDPASMMVWRCSRLAVVFGWAVLGAILAAAAVLVVAAGVRVVDAAWGESAALVAVVAVLVAASWVVRRTTIRPRLILDGVGVAVINPWATHRFAWPDVLTADAGYYGVTISLRSGRSVTVWAVQKSNLSSWMKRATRADQVVDAIRLRAQPRP